jgi:uncharacterized DUF497 family protein
MGEVFYAERLEWDDWNRDHIAKHEVVPEEAEQVVRSDPVVLESYKGRLILIGPTSSGRMLAVIVGANPKLLNVYYVFSARPASRKERRIYEDEKGGYVR